MAKSKHSSPYTVSPPRYSFPAAATAEADQPRTLTVGGLIQSLSSFARYHKAATAEIERSKATSKHEWRWYEAGLEANVEQLQRWFNAIVGIDRVRTYLQLNSRRRLTMASARRLVDSLVRHCGLTVSEAEALSLSDAMDRLDLLLPDDQSKLTFPQWIAVLKSHEDKPAVRDALALLLARSRGDQVQVWKKWIRFPSVRSRFAMFYANQADNRRLIDKRFKAQPGYAEMVADERYADLERRRKEVIAEYDRFAEQRGWGVFALEDLTPDEKNLVNRKDAERETALKSINNECRTLMVEFGIEVMYPQLPVGWKGVRTYYDVQSIADLVKYLERELQHAAALHAGAGNGPPGLVERGRNLRELNEAVHNAFCLLRPHPVPGTPPMPPPFVKIGKAVSFLTNLVRKLRKQVKHETPGLPSLSRLMADGARIDSRPVSSDPLLALLRVLSNGVADDCIRRAAPLVDDNSLTVNEKLTKIDELIRLPATATSTQLAELLHVKPQAVRKSEWWQALMSTRRKGDEPGLREQRYRKRRQCSDSGTWNDD